MRWTPGGRSNDIEDDRSQSGGGGWIQLRRHPLGHWGISDPAGAEPGLQKSFLSLAGFGGGDNSTAISRPDPARDQSEEPLVQFVSFVLDDTQEAWTQILSEQNVPYRHAKLALFRDQINSACGRAQSASGPFYCPEDGEGSHRSSIL